jgi:uncharacterized membrane protein
MNPYLLIVFVHVAAAVVLLGGSVVGSPLVRAALRRAATAQDVRAHLKIEIPLSSLEPFSAIVVLASGIHLASVTRVWSLGWVQVAVAFWLVNAVIGGAVIKPALARLGAEAARAGDGPVDGRLDALRRSRRWSYGGDALLANDATMLFLMTTKPSLAGSLLAVTVVNAIVLAVGTLGGRARVRGRAAAAEPLEDPGRPPAALATASVAAGAGEIVLDETVAG